MYYTACVFQPATSFYSVHIGDFDSLYGDNVTNSTQPYLQYHYETFYLYFCAYLLIFMQKKILKIRHLGHSFLFLIRQQQIVFQRFTPIDIPQLPHLLYQQQQRNSLFLLKFIEQQREQTWRINDQSIHMIDFFF